MLSKDSKNRNKVGIIIQARMGSKRLPGKIMKSIENKPILFYMINQIKKSKLYNEIIICTSKKKKNDVVRKFCKNNKIICFSGDENNLVKRYYLAAKKFNIDIIVRLTADCPLIDPVVIDLCINKFLSKKYDFVANTSPPVNSTYPDGMDVEVFSFKTLEQVNLNCKSKNDLEHVTPYIWRKKKKFKQLKLNLEKNFSHLRLTLDYQEDYTLIKKIITYFNKNKLDINLKNIIIFFKKNKNLLEINKIRNNKIANYL